MCLDELFHCFVEVVYRTEINFIVYSVQMFIRVFSIFVSGEQKEYFVYFFNLVNNAIPSFKFSTAILQHRNRMNASDNRIKQIKLINFKAKI